jgi:hypothetical protein
MLNKSRIAHLCLSAILLLLVAAAPTHAGSSVIGLVKGSTNASVGGQNLLPDTTLFSGDRLEVNDGVAVVALGSTSRMTFQGDTVASFLRDSDGVAVLLGQGDVSLFHSENSMPVRVKVGDISVVPVSRFETLGDVAVGNGVVAVTVKEGSLRVMGNGQAIIVAKGHTLKLAARAGASQAASEFSVPKSPLPALQPGQQTPPAYIWGAGPSGGSLSAFASGLSHESSAKADGSEAALDAALPVPSALATTPAAADTIEVVLRPLAGCRRRPSPHEPYLLRVPDCWRPPFHPVPRH